MFAGEVDDGEVAAFAVLAALCVSHEELKLDVLLDVSVERAVGVVNGDDDGGGGGGKPMLLHEGIINAGLRAAAVEQGFRGH